MSTKQSHNTEAVFAKWAPVRKGAELAATAIEAAGLHHDGVMNIDQYRQRMDGLAVEAKQANCEKEYREALAKQLAPSASGEAIRLLESYRREVAEELMEATANEAWARDTAAQAQDTLLQATERRTTAEALIDQLDKAVAALVRA